MRLFMPCAIALALLAATPAWAREWRYSDVADLVADALPSFVNIYNRHVTKPEDGEPAAAPAVEDEIGSGVVISADGYIVTNRHVVQGAYALFVTFADGRRLPASLVLAGTAYDLAIVKVDPGAKLLQPARLGDSKTIRLGDRVVAIGNPMGFAGSVSTGVVSGLGRQLGLSAYDSLIQTDAAINKGNSGGPLFNMDGEVIGINQAIYTPKQGGSVGIGFAIPIDDVKANREQILKYGKPRIGWLGVSVQAASAPIAAALGLGADNSGGAIVGSIRPNSPAERAGLKIGDIIRTCDGKPLADAIALTRAVSQLAGRRVELRVWRNRAMIGVWVEIADNPNNVWITKMPALPTLEKLGDLGGKFADRAEGGGVEVTDVQHNSVAWYAGLRHGDIIRKIGLVDVHDVAELGAEVQRLRKSGAHGGVIYVDGPNGPRWLNVDLLE